MGQRPGWIENPSETGVKNDGDGVCTAAEIADGGCIEGLVTDPSAEPVTILKQQIKAPTGKELWMNVSLECGNFTDTSVQSASGILDTSAAAASVRVRVKVTDEYGEVRYALPKGNMGRDDITSDTLSLIDDLQGVVFCRRSQTLMAKFQGIIDFTGTGNFQADCIVEDPPNSGHFIIAPDCLKPEEVRLIVDQLHSNSFNFLLPDVQSSGVHTVEVEAWLDVAEFAEAGEAKSKATVGLGSMIIQVLRLVKDATITELVE